METYYWVRKRSGEIVRYTEAGAEEFKAALIAGEIEPMTEEDIKGLIQRGRANGYGK